MSDHIYIYIILYKFNIYSYLFFPVVYQGYKMSLYIEMGLTNPGFNLTSHCCVTLVKLLTFSEPQFPRGPDVKIHMKILCK